jgi:WD40 repeat protein
MKLPQVNACCQFSPDGRWLAVGHQSGELTLLQVNPLAVVATRQAHRDKIRSVSFSPAGTQLLTVGDDRSLQLWKFDASNAGLAAESAVSTPADVREAVFSPDGNRIAAIIYAGTVQLFDDRLGENGTFRTGGESAEVVSWSLDGRWIATGDRNGQVRIWNASDFELQFESEFMTGAVVSLSFSPESRTVLATTSAGQIALFRELKEKWETIPNHYFRMSSCKGAWLDEQRFFIAESAGSFSLASDLSAELKNVLGDLGEIAACAVSSSGQQVALVASEGTVILLPVSECHPYTMHAPHQNRALTSLVWLGESGELASAGGDDAVVIQPARAKTAWRFESRDGPPANLTASNTGDGVAWMQGEYVAWRTGAMSPVVWNANMTSVSALALLNRTTLVTASYDEAGLQVWNLAREKPSASTRLLQDVSPVASVAVISQGDQLYTGHLDGTIRYGSWTRPDSFREVIRHGESILQVAISGDAAVLATLAQVGEARELKVWQTSSHRPQSWKKPWPRDVKCLAISADGRTIAFARSQGRLQLIDAQRGFDLLSLEHGRGRILALAFHPANDRLAAGDDRGNIYIWQSTPPGR